MNMIARHILAGFLFAVVVLRAPAATSHWPQFRGPNGAGVADGQQPLIQFGPGTNQLWKVPLASGASSPCVWRDAIFLTAFNEGKLETICLNRRDGKVRWRQIAPAERIEPFHATEGSPAASTPATDGRHLISYFGSCGLVCYGLSGKELWRLPLPVAQQIGDFGSGASPIIAGGLVIVNRDQMSGSELLAVDVRTGKVAWRADRSEFKSGWSSPAIWMNNGTREVVLPGFVEMRAYNLKTGEERWRLRGLPTAVCTTPVAGNGLLFFAGWAPGKSDEPLPTFDSTVARVDKNKDGIIAFEEADEMIKNFFTTYDANRDGRITREEWDAVLKMLGSGENALLAVRPGGKGNITESHVAWKQTRGLPYVASPLVYRGRVYIVKDGGMISCFDAATGKPVYEQERIGALGNYQASPVAADGRIYVASVNGVMTVLDAGDKPDVLARTELRERLMATPAIVDNKLYVRTANHLWAFGK